jgi:hypothetical protein
MRPISNAIIMSVLALFLTPLASAAICTFNTDTVTKTDTLLNDCETSSTVTVNDGFTLDGKGHVITAILDPSTSSFSGSALITNASGASTMLVKNVIVDFWICRLRGTTGNHLQFSGRIYHGDQCSTCWSVVHFFGCRPLRE